MFLHPVYLENITYYNESSSANFSNFWAVWEDSDFETELWNGTTDNYFGSNLYDDFASDDNYVLIEYFDPYKTPYHIKGFMVIEDGFSNEFDSYGAE